MEEKGAWGLVQKMREVQQRAMEELGPIGEEGGRNREKVVQEMPVVVQMGVAGVFLTVLGKGEAGKVVVETGGGARKMATRKRR